MSHELAFADAARPSPVVVLNLLLADYSIGHELLLYRRRNALLVTSAADFSKLELWEQIYAIREAVWLCGQPFSFWQRIERPERIMWAFRKNLRQKAKWLKLQGGMMPDDYALAVAEFRNYLAAGQAWPVSPTKHAIDVLYPDERDNTGRTFGQPFMLTLYNFVCKLPAGERPACAWDFSYARASWLYFAACEIEGAYRIENAKERQVQDEKDQFEREIAEEKKLESRKPKKGSVEQNVPQPDLATAIPPELKGKP